MNANDLESFIRDVQRLGNLLQAAHSWTDQELLSDLETLAQAVDELVASVKQKGAALIAWADGPDDVHRVLADYIRRVLADVINALRVLGRGIAEFNRVRRQAPDKPDEQEAAKKTASSTTPDDAWGAEEPEWSRSAEKPAGDNLGPANAPGSKPDTPSEYDRGSISDDVSGVVRDLVLSIAFGVLVALAAAVLTSGG